MCPLNPLLDDAPIRGAEAIDGRVGRYGDLQAVEQIRPLQHLHDEQVPVRGQAAVKLPQLGSNRRDRVVVYGDELRPEQLGMFRSGGGDEKAAVQRREADRRFGFNATALFSPSGPISASYLRPPSRNGGKVTGERSKSIGSSQHISAVAPPFDERSLS
jgi:hypothetical protein